MVTNNEYQVLSAIWTAGHALTAKEILSYIEVKGFKERTVHSIITAMIEKNILFVDGQKRSNRTYSRCFNTDIKFEDYQSTQIKQDAIYSKSKNDMLPGIFSALINDDDLNSDTLSKLEEMLKKKQRGDDNGIDHI